MPESFLCLQNLLQVLKLCFSSNVFFYRKRALLNLGEDAKKSLKLCVTISLTSAKF